MMKIVDVKLNKKYSKITVFLFLLAFSFNFINIIIH